MAQATALAPCCPAPATLMVKPIGPIGIVGNGRNRHNSVDPDKGPQAAIQCTPDHAWASATGQRMPHSSPAPCSRAAEKPVACSGSLLAAWMRASTSPEPGGGGSDSSRTPRTPLFLLRIFPHLLGRC